MLTTARLRLRALHGDDAPAVFAFASLPAVPRFMAWTPHKTLEESRQFLVGTGGGPRWLWGIEQAGQVIGMVSLSPVVRGFRTAELGYVLAPEAWGRGIATEAARAARDFGFAELRFNRVQAMVASENRASIRVLDKLAFQREGTMRQYQLSSTGIVLDMEIHALLRAEWNDLPGALPGLD